MEMDCELTDPETVPIAMDHRVAEGHDRPEGASPQPKRARPDNSDAGHMDALQKLVTVDSKTPICTGEVPDEEPQPVWSEAWDDTTGAPLDPNLVKEARQAEMSYIHGRGVWRKIGRDVANRNGWNHPNTLDRHQ